MRLLFYSYTNSFTFTERKLASIRGLGVMLVDNFKLKKMKKLALLVLAITSWTIVFGQVSKEYLSSKQIQQLEDNETNSWKLQDYAVLFSKIGNYKASLAAQNLYLEKNKAAMNIPAKPKADSVYFKSFQPQSAIDVIAKAAKNYKVVITNEAHYQPQNRVFTSLLLDTLYKEGFRYLCVEDLSKDDTVYKSKEDTQLNSRKYPIKTTGFYMDEPQYGNLVRHALKLGYTLVPYEYYASNGKDSGKGKWTSEKYCTNISKRPKGKNISALRLWTSKRKYYKRQYWTDGCNVEITS